MHLASARLDRASCGSAGTFASWAAHRRAGDPIDPERNHADPGSTSTSATVDRGALRLLPTRLPSLSSPRLPSGTCKGNVMPLPLAALGSHPPVTSNLQIPAVGLRHARAAGLWKLCRSCEDRLGASFGRRRHHRTDDLRITRVFPCVARGFRARASFMFAGGCRWRSLAVDGSSGASRGHTPVVRRPGSRWSGAIERPSVFQAGHIPSWRGSCKRDALSLVAAVSGWLLLLLPQLLSAAGTVTHLRGFSGAATEPCSAQAASPPHPIAAQP